MKRKKFFAILLASAMVVSMAACGNDEQQPSDSSSTPASDSSETPDASGAGDEVDGAASYTYDIAFTACPTNWNPHTYQTATDGDYMLSYLSDGFYVFDYNEDKTGYALVPGMTTAEPTDVTSQYVGQYGIQEGDSAKAWSFPLRNDLCWEDGTPITAKDFVRSAELLLNPVAGNYRADTFYSGSKEIANAKAYVYQGTTAYATSVTQGGSTYITLEDIVKDEAGTYTYDGRPIAFNLENGGDWSNNSLQAYHDAEDYTALFLKDGVDLWTEVITPAADADGWVLVNDETWGALVEIIAHLQGHENFEAYEAANKDNDDYANREWEEFCFYGETYGDMTFDQVGIFATSDTELVLVFVKPLAGFDLLYAMTDSWLVNEELYTKCESVKDGVYTNSYGTSVDTTISYGPYKLAAYQADKEYTLERNDNFYSVKEGFYQTTKIVIRTVQEAATRLELFLSGVTDSYGLSSDDMDTYAASDYTYYTKSPSTFFIALSPDLDALTKAQDAMGAGYNKTILTVKEFRQAMAYALDRTAFALAVSPTNNPAFGVYSELIISDPENAVSYRSNDEAKWVLANFWGLSDDIGEGKMYETVDDAVESITGYNLEMARQYFDIAYDKAIEAGLMKEGDTVSITIGLPSTSNTYVKGYEYLSSAYQDAVVGTKLEGKLVFDKDDTIGNAFSDALKSNQVNMLFFVGWSGSALDPYGLMEAYTSPTYQYDPSWDTSKETITINLGGTDYTASVIDWTYCISGETITITAADGSTKEYSAGSSDNVPEERMQILAAIENAVLQTYDLIPLVDDAGAGLKGMQITYGTEEYYYGIGRGGEKYMTYNYTDAEWEEYVASQGGQLNYK